MDFADTLAASFNRVISDLVSALPAIIGALLILLIGWIIARVVSSIVRKLLERSGADRQFAQRGREVYGDQAASLTPSKIGGMIVFWVILLIFFIAATNFLGWQQVSLLLQDFIGWLPHLVVGVIILIAAPIVGRLVRRAVESGSSQAGMNSGRTLGRIAEIAVIGFLVIVAMNQVGLASDLVNILFIGVVVALALAFGLAFGLGGREVAGRVTEDWYEKSKEAASRAQQRPPEAQPRAAVEQPVRPSAPMTDPSTPTS